MTLEDSINEALELGRDQGFAGTGDTSCRVIFVARIVSIIFISNETKIKKEGSFVLP